MSTVGVIIDRIYRDYLSNPQDTPVQGRINGNITAGAGSIIYRDEFMPEEIDSMDVGALVEVDRELFRIVGHDETTRTLTVTPGMYGTTQAAHLSNALLKVAPKWPRQTVFDAVADEITSLYPMVYHEGQERGWPTSTTVELDASLNAVSVLDARQFIAGEYVPIAASLVRVDGFSTGVGIQYMPRATTGDVFFRYARSFSRPTAETDTLASLGVDTSWERILVFGALAWLLVGTDIDAATVQFITESLEAQGFPVTTGTSLSVTLTRMRETELRKAADRIRARNRTPVSYRREL